LGIDYTVWALKKNHVYRNSPQNMKTQHVINPALSSLYIQVQ